MLQVVKLVVAHRAAQDRVKMDQRQWQATERTNRERTRTVVNQDLPRSCVEHPFSRSKKKLTGTMRLAICQDAYGARCVRKHRSKKILTGAQPRITAAMGCQ